jgi:hypothetical protein
MPRPDCVHRYPGLRFESLLGWHSILLGPPASGNRVTLTESHDLPQTNLCVLAATLLPRDQRTLAFQIPIRLGSVPGNDSGSLRLRAIWNARRRIRAFFSLYCLRLTDARGSLFASPQEAGQLLARCPILSRQKRARDCPAGICNARCTSLDVYFK